VRRINKNIARVHVRMEQVMAEHLSKENLKAAFCQQTWLNASGANALDIVYRNAVDAIRHHHLVGTQLGWVAGICKSGLNMKCRRMASALRAS
jgi:hypothetical protein